ncbi:MAG: formimidoylglutamase [Marinifilaceae bacterium]
MYSKNYRPTAKDFWTGRIDDPNDYDAFRWHQIIRLIDLNSEEAPQNSSGFCFLGFCCDKGVEKNLGRTGTSKGPESIRREMANLPCAFPEGTQIFDAGDIYCPDGKLTDVQESLASAVNQILKMGLFPIILGGGHEIAFGHYLGIEPYLEEKGKSLGIVNLDAHFDMRPYHDGPTSGTMFRQIADRCQEKDMPFSYLVAGIQQYGNTVSLFKEAKELGSEYIMARDITSVNMPNVTEQLLHFLSRHDQIYLTLCSDVISSAYAPGVSAPQPFGLHPEKILQIIKMIVRSGKVISFDIAEVSPRFDEDNRTSKLAAIIAFAVINTAVEAMKE